jgi:hypothetical protein
MNVTPLIVRHLNAFPLRMPYCDTLRLMRLASPLLAAGMVADFADFHVAHWVKHRAAHLLSVPALRKPVADAQDGRPIACRCCHSRA